MLEALERGNLFVVRLDDRRRWYRYHQLFADVLPAHLADEQPERVPELHRRASAWHERNGEPSEAIRHAHHHPRHAALPLEQRPNRGPHQSAQDAQTPAVRPCRPPSPEAEVASGVLSCSCRTEDVSTERHPSIDQVGARWASSLQP
jgi:hypothetical protein